MQDQHWLQMIVTLPYILLLSLLGGLAGFIMRLNEATERQPLKALF